MLNRAAQLLLRGRGRLQQRRSTAARRAIAASCRLQARVRAAHDGKEKEESLAEEV